MPRKYNNPRRRPRRFKKKKSAPASKAYVRKQINKQQAKREIKTSLQAVNVDHLAHSANNTGTSMKNGLVIFPAPFNSHTPLVTQGTGSDDILGEWIMPRYLVQRIVINFASLATGDHVDTGTKGLQVRVRYGFICNTGHKYQASLGTSYAVWQADINKMVMKELQDSGIDDDFTTFSKRNRTVKMVGDFTVKPNLNNRVAELELLGNAGHHMMYAPPKNIEIKWHTKKFFPRQKQRMTSCHNGYCLNNTWVPFCYLSSPNITTGMGNLDIQNSSKFYYTDP